MIHHGRGGKLSTRLARDPAFVVLVVPPLSERDRDTARVSITRVDLLALAVVGFIAVGSYLSSSSLAPGAKEGTPSPRGGDTAPQVEATEAVKESRGPDEATTAAQEDRGPREAAAFPVQDGHAEREKVFTNIYRTNEWGSRESRSGYGSELGATESIRRFIGLAFKVFNITSLLDSPCGDCNWQPHVPGFDGTQYTGVDIVKDVIEANTEKYKDRPNMRFFQVDLALDPLPQGSYDSVLCRDMVQHLPLQAGLDAYRALETSGAKYLLTSFHSETGAHTEEPAGGYHYIDPMLPPFNFTEPIMYGVDGKDHLIETVSGRTNYKMIGLWRLPALGKGTGNSIAPTHTEALNNKVIVLDKVALELLRKEGMEDFECHRAELCQG